MRYKYTGNFSSQLKWRKVDKPKIQPVANHNYRIVVKIHRPRIKIFFTSTNKK